ncbi:DUF6470 family protein [Paenibacillus sp. FSL K6-1230]|uniref:DUF6470 family protein n=1 Tax=Paenibacillus sp. FSL K6-1230 TaxID=2921603 RepID=UPI0030FBF42A
MDFPKIQIQQGYSKIGLETTKGQWSIQQPKAELNMHQASGELNIEYTPGKLDVDQSKAWSALGLARSIEMLDRIAQNAWDSSMQNIAEIAQAGDQMMAIENKQNAFAAIAYQNAMKDRPMEIRGPASYDNVDITYTPGITDIQYTANQVKYDPEYNKPIIEYSPGGLEIYLTQKNFIHFSTIGTQLDAVV